MPATGTSTTPDGYSMQETGQIPYNPYNEQYGLSSPYADFLMAGYDPDDTSWLNQYEEEGMAAFEGTGIPDYDPYADYEMYDQGSFDTGDGSFDAYDPYKDYEDWSMQNPEEPTAPPADTSQPAPSSPLPEPPMPPWMQNLAEGKAYAPWSLIYNNPTPFASKEQWTNMNESERRGLMGSLPEYIRQDYLDNMQKAFVKGVDKNSAQGFIA